MNFINHLNKRWPLGWELGVLLAGLGALFFYNIFTATSSPMPWGDEVMLCDPAIRWHLGHGFTSTAWASQDGNSFFSCNVPIYALLLRGWIEVFGLSLTSIRTFSFTCFCFAIFVLWLGIWRAAVLKSPLLRLAAIGLLCSGFGMVFMYRNARYDALAFLLTALLFYFWSDPCRARRLSAVFGLGFFVPWTGLQLIPYYFIACIFSVFLENKRYLDSILSLGIGSFFGLFSLLVLYFFQGTLKLFLSAIVGLGPYFKVGDRGYLSKFESLPHAFFGDPFEFWQTDRIDPSSAILFFILIFCLIWEVARKRQASPLIIAALGLAIIIPLALHLLAHFRIYYRWMVFVPCVICVFKFLENNQLILDKKLKIFLFGGLLMSGILGLPLRILFLGLSSDHRDYTSVQNAAAAHLDSSDTVYTDAIGYFAAVPHAKNVYSVGYILRMTDAEKAGINALAIGSDKEKVLGALSGTWTKIFDQQGSPQAFSGAYSLEIYRRKPCTYSIQATQ
jgi:hypothetical protein